MDYRALTVSAVFATAVVGFAPICRADIVASEGGIAVRDAGVAAPARGMTMSQVASKFGDPVSKVPAVGTPPISRWEYSSFVVYFERDHVIHAVVSGAATDSSGAAAPPAAPPAAAAAPAPIPEPAPAAAPVEAPVAQAPVTQAPVTQAPVAPPPPVAQASLTPASTAAIEAPPRAPSAPAESEAPAQP